MVSRYLKSGSSKNLSNYVKYIATREGAATVKENNGTAPATKKQQELISSLLEDFSYSKNSSLMDYNINVQRELIKCRYHTQTDGFYCKSNILIHFYNLYF